MKKSKAKDLQEQFNYWHMLEKPSVFKYIKNDFLTMFENKNLTKAFIFCILFMTSSWMTDFIIEQWNNFTAFEIYSSVVIFIITLLIAGIVGSENNSTYSWIATLIILNISHNVDIAITLIYVILILIKYALTFRKDINKWNKFE